MNFKLCLDQCERERSIDPIISSRKLRRMTKQQCDGRRSSKNGRERKRERETSLCGPDSGVRSNDAPELISPLVLSLFLRPIMLSSLSLKPQNKMSPSGTAGAWRAGDPVALRPSMATHLFLRRQGEEKQQRSLPLVSGNDRKARFITKEREKEYVQRSEKWLVRGWVKFVPAPA